MCYKQDSCHSYQLVLEPMSWYEAQRYCREKYTDLVSIRDQEQNEEVNLNGKISTTPFWIGLLCDDWEWTDGGLSTYRNWGTDQPQRPGDCTKLQRGKWISVSCNTGFPALCYHSNATGGSRLRTFNITGYENLTQSEAQTACRRNYTDLITVYSEEDNSVLANLTEEAGLYAAWIGLQRSQPRCKWSNGDAVTFRNSTQHCGTWSCCAAMKAEGSWDCNNCTQKKNFMCYKQDSCHSYQLVLEPMSWYEAQRYCREKYTDLVSIRDQEQNEEVNLNGKNSTTPFWIGLLCDDWEWTDGGLSTYRNWETDQPQTTGDCTTLLGGKWISVSCNTGFPALCYHSNATVFSAAGGSRLRTFHITGYQNLTQFEAQTACRRNYTNLVTVYSEEDNSVLANLTEEAGLYAAWIGLQRSQPRCKWSNGDAVTFRNSTQHCGTWSCCAAMKAEGSWDCNNCTQKKNFMCYKQDSCHSYQLVLEPMSWYEAQRYCREKYTDLVSIRDQEQNEEVNLNGKNSTTPFWIGLLCDDWEWTDGGLSTYRNWETDQPQTTGDCTTLLGGKWISVSCNTGFPALCYHSNATVFSAAGGSRLRTFHITGYQNLTQFEAQTACRRNYTNLVTVYSEEDNSVLANLTEEAGLYAAWIGLQRSQPRCKWSNGDAVTFRNSTQHCGTWSCCAAMKAEGSWDCNNCTQKKNFMCYKQDSCHSYQLVLEPMSWYEAQRYCREKYTDLVSIRDQEQNEEVNLNGKNSTTPFWIGLLCDDWEWTDGGLSTYRNWETDQSQRTGDCTKLQRGKWISVSCNTGFPALCYHSNATVFSAPGGNRLRTFYIIVDESLTQSEAQTACRRNYTDLVTVYSEEDNSVLANLTEEAGLYAAWIGLQHSRPSYKWSNGDAVTFRNSTQQCGSLSCCATMMANGSWESNNCTEKNHFMCYKQGVIRAMFSYQLVLEPMSWYEAQRYCREKYTDLVSIRDQEQNEEVNLNGKNSTTPFWIGLLCDDWEWADGGLSTYRNWRSRVPQPCDCVKLMKDEWSPSACNDPASALCYSTSIHVSEVRMIWEKALDYCQEGNRSGLLRIESDLDQKEVESELRRNKVPGPVWVGLKQSRLFGFWIWSNGMVVGSWTNWKGGRQPELPLSHQCGAIETRDQGYMWMDMNCRNELRVLCEVK
ncbi:macrophage mannose receptor 1-like isoform X4 [Brachyhypopomus gauderio]|uniref:macrophage mannose receptor 1-like isoform X4 n=1 Tax=Brachyhypopomus gauderio TaxID=698409 RepID=UPI00404176EA